MIKISRELTIDLQQESASAVSLEANGMAFFNLEWIKAVEWKILITECKFKDENGILSSACSARNWKQGTCFSLNNYVLGYNVELDHSSLSLLPEVFVSPSYSLKNRSGGMMLLSDCDYYWAIASDEEFILSLCNNKPFLKLDEFREGIEPYINSELPEVQHVGRKLADFSELAKATWN